MGAGPMTGRGAGFCAGFKTPGYFNPFSESSLWAGGGRGRGFGRMILLGGLIPGSAYLAYRLANRNRTKRGQDKI